MALMKKLTGYLSGSDSKTLENGKKADIKINIDKQKRLMQNIFTPSSSAEGGSGFINCPVK